MRRMQHLTNTDLHFVLARVPSDVRKLCRKHGLAIAGGYIRATIAGERPSDIDLFGSDKEVLEKAARELTGDRRGKFHETDNAYTVLSPPRYPVQFIHRWLFDEPQDLLASFDFSIAQAAIWWDKDGIADDGKGNWWSGCGDRFYTDLAAKRLHYLHPAREEEAGGSLMRVIKFIRQGYNIQAPSLAGVIARLSMKIRSDTMFSDSEEGHTRVITSLIREVDPLMLVDGVELVDEHQLPDLDE